MTQYSGSGEDRKIIREHEFFFAGDRKTHKHTKFEVLLASYETVLRDRAHFQKITWQVCIEMTLASCCMLVDIHEGPSLFASSPWTDQPLPQS